MKKILLVAASLAFCLSASAQTSIADALCRNQANSLRTILQWQKQGVPLRTAMNVFKREPDGNIRELMWTLTENIYHDPKEAQDFINSNRFHPKCMKKIRSFGY